MVRFPARLLCLVGILAGMLCMPATGLAAQASIDIQRSPAPPFAVINDGNGSVQYTITLDIDTNPCYMTVDVNGPTAGGPALFAQTLIPLFAADFTTVASRKHYTNSGVFAIPANTAPGDYYITASFFQDAGGCAADHKSGGVIENSVSPNFIVAAAGQLTIRKYEDGNGDAQRSASELGLPGWKFNVEAWIPDAGGDYCSAIVGVQSADMAVAGPAAGGCDPSNTFQLTTGANGSVSLAGPAGRYRVTELPQNGWFMYPATGMTRMADVAAGPATPTEFPFGNMRPGSICGVAWLDKDRDGLRDVAEEGRFSDVVISLQGGAAITSKLDPVAQPFVFASPVPDVKTDKDGAYCFTSLVAGPYNITSADVTDHASTGDADGAGNGTQFIGPVQLPSGGSVINQDFGFAPPLAQMKITKSADVESTKAGSIITWTVVVTNDSKVDVESAVLRDPLPRGLSITSLGGAKLTSGSLVWQLGDIATGASVTKTFKTKVSSSAGKSVTNVARATADNAAAVKAQDKVTITVGTTPTPGGTTPVTPAVTG